MALLDEVYVIRKIRRTKGGGKNKSNNLPINGLELEVSKLAKKTEKNLEKGQSNYRKSARKRSKSVGVF